MKESAATIAKYKKKPENSGLSFFINWDCLSNLQREFQ